MNAKIKKASAALLFVVAVVTVVAHGGDVAFSIKTTLPDGSDAITVKSSEMANCREAEGRIEWKGHPLLGESFTATATLRPAANGGREWSFEYSGNESGRFVEEVSFPEWTVPRSDKARLLVPHYNGVIRSPDWSRFTAGATVDRRGPVFMGFHFIAMLEDGGVSRYLDQRGEARMYSTRFEVAQGTRPGTCVLKSVHEMPLSPETARAYRIPYGGVMSDFSGGWFAAACIYREWVRGQGWYRRAVSRDFSKLKDISLWMWNRGRSDVTVPPALKFMKDTGLKCALDWYWWHGIPYDTCYPFFWPPREPEADFKAAVKSIHDAGGYVQPYTNGMLWDCDDSRWAEGGADCAIVGKDGKPKATMFNPYTKQRQAWMCGEAPQFQEKMRTLERTIRETGMDGVYMDMIASAAFGGCRNPRHRHPKGGGRHMTDGYRAFVENVRADNPGFCIASEEQTEAYLDLFDALIYVYPSHERFGRFAPEYEDVPASLAVFHGAVVCFGSFATIDNLPPWDEKWGENPHRDGDVMLEKKFPDQFAVEFSRGVSWGLQPTVHKFLLSHATEWRFAEEYRFVKDTARFYIENRDLLFDGEMLDPGMLKCDCRRVEFLRRSSYTKPENVKSAVEPALPTIFASAWRSKAGKRAAVLVNWSRDEQPYEYRYGTRTFRGRLAPRSWARLALPVCLNVKPGDSLVAVRDRVRAMPMAEKANGVDIVLADGTYHIDKPISFKKEDSGTAAHPVVWRAENKGKVRLPDGNKLEGRAHA